MNRLPPSVIATPSYCEENVYNVLNYLQGCLPKTTRLFAVFISNSNRSVLLWQQKTDNDGPYIIWDYHVIAVAVYADDALVYDVNSKLGCPVNWQGRRICFWKTKEYMSDLSSKPMSSLDYIKSTFEEIDLTEIPEVLHRFVWASYFHFVMAINLFTNTVSSE
jgi:hypothetical protein